MPMYRQTREYLQPFPLDTQFRRTYHARPIGANLPKGRDPSAVLGTGSTERVLVLIPCQARDRPTRVGRAVEVGEAGQLQDSRTAEE